jgi:release factor glutamine methyltransferase
MRRELRLGDSVADICTGSGALAIAAALSGAGRVTAVDVSRKAVLATRLNARLNGVSVRALRGDIFECLTGEQHDLIVSNPPYVPAPADVTPERGLARAWDAGHDGRLILDRICTEVSDYLTPGGTCLLVHSDLCGTERTLEQLTEAGLQAEVAATHTGKLGPLMASRAQWLKEEGRLADDQHHENLVVVRARRTPAAARIEGDFGYARGL